MPIFRHELKAKVPVNKHYDQWDIPVLLQAIILLETGFFLHIWETHAHRVNICT